MWDVHQGKLQVASWSWSKEKVMCTTGRTGGARLPKTVIAQVDPSYSSRTLDARGGTLGFGIGSWSCFGPVLPAVVVILDFPVFRLVSQTNLCLFKITQPVPFYYSVRK